MAHLDASGITRLVTDLKDRFATLTSGAVPITQGGTGATTAADAVVNVVDGQHIKPQQISATSDIYTNSGNIYTDSGHINTDSGYIRTRNGNIYTLNGEVSATSGTGASAVTHNLTDKQDQHATATCSLTVAGWSGNAQTATATGVTATNTVIVAPAPASAAAWAAAGVICTAQAAGSLTFTCTTAPTEALTANVLILG
jgi:hypothetical protein